MKRSDQRLILAYLAGDEKSLEILIKRYLGPIYGFALRRLGNKQESEDTTQEIFVKVWKNLKKFKKQKNFRNWIFSIAKNACIDVQRKPKKTIVFSEVENSEWKNAFAETITDSALLPDELIKKQEITEKLKSAMTKLSPKYRQVLLIRYYSDLTFRKMAKLVGGSIDTLKTRHRRAISVLKKALKETEL